MARIHFQTLGCRLNQAESERMARGFRLAGHEVVDDPAAADLRVINTCTVTKNAGDDSRKAAKRHHDAQKIVVTGCHSEMHKNDFAQADFIVSNEEKEELAALVIERFGMDGLALGMDRGNDALYPLQLKHTRAFVKIQDGCNHRCSFCLTTLARGISRSRSAEEILTEIRGLSEQGCQEAVLTGVHAGSYGLDLDQDLGWLMGRILEETDIPRLRLSSLEPWNFKRSWVALWERHAGRLCRHLHMSLQSGSDTVLQRMCRNYDGETYAGKIAAAREIHGMAITTDIIVGFPGETEAEHQASLDFARAMEFAGAHLFTYSPRPGTAAAGMPDHVPAAIKKQRFADMKAVVDESESTFQDAALGSEQDVLWEREDGKGRMHGLSDHYIKVATDAALARPNTITRTRLLRRQGTLVMGEPVKPAAAESADTAAAPR